MVFSGVNRSFCVPLDEQLGQMFFGKIHKHMVFLRCEFFYVEVDSDSRQIFSRKLHICMVFLQCEFFCGSLETQFG